LYINSLYSFSMMQSSNKVGKRGPRKNQRNSVRNGTSFPAQLSASIQVDKVYRFQATTAETADPVSSSALLDLLCLATAANAAYEVASSVKLRKIEMWAPPASTGASVRLAIEDLGTTSTPGGPSRVKEDISMGTARPAHVIWTPAPGSVQSMWQSQQAIRLVELTFTIGTVIDLHISQILQDGETPVAVGNAVAAATVGQLYLRSLDNDTGRGGANVLQPVDFPFI